MLVYRVIEALNRHQMVSKVVICGKYNEYFMLAPVMWGWRPKNSNTQRKLPSKIAFKVVFLSQPRPGKPRSGRPTGVFLSKDAFTKLVALYWLLHSRLTKGSNSVKDAG